jgi:hypothetical protein
MGGGPLWVGNGRSGDPCFSAGMRTIADTRGQCPERQQSARSGHSQNETQPRHVAETARSCRPFRTLEDPLLHSPVLRPLSNVSRCFQTLEFRASIARMAPRAGIGIHCQRDGNWAHRGPGQTNRRRGARIRCIRQCEHCQYQRPSARNRECSRPARCEQTNPSGQRARSSAASRCASVPCVRMNALNDIPS